MTSGARFRPASLEDADLLLDWRNDEVTRQNSLDHRPVQRAEHQRWLSDSLTSGRRRILIFEEDGQPCGVLRGDALGDAPLVTELSWTVAPKHRGRGIGRRMLTLALAEFAGILIARILASNGSSLAMAHAVGFRRLDVGASASPVPGPELTWWIFPRTAARRNPGLTLSLPTGESVVAPAPVVTAIVQARMASERLPGKVLLPVRGRPLLAYLIERLRGSREVHQIAIATSDAASDDALVEFCQAEGIRVTRGPHHDVLGRYRMAATATGGDVIVRVTGDCPLLDPAVVDLCVATYLDADPPFDYVSNTQSRRYPRGLDVEVFSRAGLGEADVRATQPFEREHVTPYFYTHPERFRIGQVVPDFDLSNHRWTVDTPEDFELVRLLIEELYPRRPAFDLNDLKQTIDANPSWSSLNAAVTQKELKGTPTGS